MDDEDDTKFATAIHRIATWLLAAITTVGAGLLWNTYVLVSEHRGLFASVWNSEYRRQIDTAIKYTDTHEQYRTLYVEQNDAFKNDVRERCVTVEARVRRLERVIDMMHHGRDE